MKDKFTKDLLDLCRLNRMEENVKDSPASDRDSTLKLIDIKKREKVVRLQNAIGDDPPEIIDWEKVKRDRMAP